MGFDVHGISPKSDVGSYFRNNVWWWRPLWHYISQSCEDILSEDELNSGSYNDGCKISKIKATKIAERLAELIASGDVKKFETEYNKNIAKLNKTNQDGSDNWDANYPFSEENVIEFMTFCSESGGFEIW